MSLFQVTVVVLFTAFNLVVSLKSHPNQYGLYQTWPFCVNKRPFCVAMQLFLHCFNSKI